MASTSAFQPDFYGSEYWFDFDEANVLALDSMQCGGCIMAGYHWIVDAQGPRKIAPYSYQETMLDDRVIDQEYWVCLTNQIFEDDEFNSISSS